MKTPDFFATKCRTFKAKHRNFPSKKSDVFIRSGCRHKKKHTDCEGTLPPPKKGKTRHRKKKAGNASEENGKTKIVLHMAFKSTMMQNEKDYFLLKCQTFYHKTMCQPSIFLRKSLNLHHQAHGFRLISAIHHTFNYKVY